MGEASLPDHKNHLNNPGDVGEAYVNRLSSFVFIKDFFFSNPVYQLGGKEGEFSDGLLWLDNQLVIIQTKTADPVARRARTPKKEVEWLNRKIKKAILQCQSAVDHLDDGSTVVLTNEYRKNLQLRADDIEHAFCVAVIDHLPTEFTGKPPTVVRGSSAKHALIVSHADLVSVFEELSTAGDFIDYLEARDEFFKLNELRNNSELDLLAVYKLNPEEFERRCRNGEAIQIEPGAWDEFVKEVAREARTVANSPSYIVDEIISHMHGGQTAELEHIRTLQDEAGDLNRREYHLIATELAKIRRIDRRSIGNRIFDKSKLCREQGRSRYFFTASDRGQHIGIVFLVSTEARIKRCRHLQTLVVAAKVINELEQVVGVAIDPVFIDNSDGFAIDAMLFAAGLESHGVFDESDVEEMRKLFSAPARAEDVEFEDE